MPKNYYVGLEALDYCTLFLANLVQLAEYVADQYRATCESLDSLKRELPRAIIVSFNRKYWRNLFQPLYDFDFTDVAAVDDVIDASEYRYDGRVESTMGIRDYA